MKISCIDPCIIILFYSKVVKGNNADDEDEIVQWSDDSSMVLTPPSRLPGLCMYVVITNCMCTYTALSSLMRKGPVGSARYPLLNLGFFFFGGGGGGGW